MSRVAEPPDPFEALAHPMRRRILERLRDDRVLTAGEIAAGFPEVSRAAVSRHLGVLRRARLVRSRTEGREAHYRLDAAPLARIYSDWLATFAPFWEESLQRLKSRVEGGRDGP